MKPTRAEVQTAVADATAGLNKWSSTITKCVSDPMLLNAQFAPITAELAYKITAKQVNRLLELLEILESYAVSEIDQAASRKAKLSVVR